MACSGLLATVRHMEPTSHDLPAARRPAPRVAGPPPRRGRGQVRAIARAAGRTCSRPGCDTPAAATLVFSYREQVARVVELLDQGEPQAYDLCGVHADRTRPPVGWELADTRPPRTDTPRRLDDDETVAVLAAALRGEVPPTRVSVLEGGGEDERVVAAAASDGDADGADAPDQVDRHDVVDEFDEDPLRAALEELQRVATPDDDIDPVAATPLRRDEPTATAPVTTAPAPTVADGEDDLTLW